MMKKRLIVMIILAVILSVSLFLLLGYRKKKDANTDNNNPSVETLVKWMKDGTYSFEYEIIQTGETRLLALEGNNSALVIDGQGRVIIKDRTMYTIHDTIKEIGKGLLEEKPNLNVYTNIDKTGNGEGTVNGKTLPYEEYTDSENGSKTRFYMQNGQVYALVRDSGINAGFEIIIKNAKNSVPTGVFDIPISGYTMFDVPTEENTIYEEEI